MAHAVPTQKSSIVLTLSTCRNPSSAHAFSLPIDGSDCADAVAQTLQRAGEKLGFDCHEVIDITVFEDKYTPDSTVRSSPLRWTEEGCCCGAADKKCASRDAAQMLCNLLDDTHKQMQKSSGLRPRAKGLLHVVTSGEPSARPEPQTAVNAQTSPATVRPHAEAPKPLGRRELQLRKKSPRSLRQDAQGLWAVLEKFKVYIPPVPDEEPTSNDRFHLERHGHGRGNTKSTKKRRKREDRESLCIILRFGFSQAPQQLRVRSGPTWHVHLSRKPWIPRSLDTPP